MNEAFEPRKIRLTQWVSILVVVALVGILVGLLAMNILDARERSLRRQTANQLKQIGLSLLNYHDVYRKLPPGGTLNPQGKPHHGWATSILPYMEANPMYTYIDMNLPWNDPLNQHIFRFPYRPFKSPLIPIEFTSTGYALNHFSANEKLFQLNRSSRLDESNEDEWNGDELDAGQSNVWLVQELFDDWHPWGSVQNFSELNWPPAHLDPKLRWGKGTLQVVMADASVVTLRADTDGNSIRAIKNHPAVVEQADLVSLPKPTYQYSNPKWNFELVSLPDRQNVVSHLRIIKNDRGQDGFVEVSSRADVRMKLQKGNAFVNSTLDELQSAIQSEPHMSSLKIQIPFDIHVANKLSQLQDLKYVEVGKYHLPQEGIAALKKLPMLETIVCRCSKEQKEFLEGQLRGVTAKGVTVRLRKD